MRTKTFRSKVQSALGKPFRHLSEQELTRLSPEGPWTIANRKYSLGLLEEAAALAKRIGAPKAAKEAGMSVSTLRHYISAKRLMAGYKPRRIGGGAANGERKRMCYRVFLDLLRTGYSGNKRKCWIEAGRITGVNGRSVEFQIDRGLWKP